MLVLRGAASARRHQTAVACIRLLAHHAEDTVVTELARLPSGGSDEVAAEAAGALGRCGLAAAEAPLVEALRHRAAEVRAAAVSALGRVGSAACVPPLQDLAAAPDSGRGLHSAAAAAVAEVQSRLPGASPGQVSLASGEVGHLSLAADASGRVTPTED